MNKLNKILLSGLVPLATLTGCNGDDPGPLPQNTPPTITDPGVISVAENSSAVATIDINDVEGNPLTITTSGDDADAFTVGEDGSIRFAILADYENPEDSNADNTYEFTITVSDGYNSPESIDIVVTVTDIENDVVASYEPIVPTTATEGLTTDEFTFSAENLISSFEAPTEFSAYPAQISVTGVFADAAIAASGAWSNFNDLADSAYVGNTGVSTCEIDGVGGNCDAPTGSIKIKNIEVKQNYIQFLMSGGNGSNEVGIQLLYSSAATDNEEVVLGIYTPNSCGDAWVKGDQHWVHFDVSDMIGEEVSLLIYDNEEAGCGFVAFDHLYQTPNALGTFGGRINRPALPGVDSDSDGVADTEDAFPNDPNESADTDLDGVGDNSDAFPEDATESVDSDQDGVGDNSDARPDDASVTIQAVGVTVNDEAIDEANIIATFDDPVAILADTEGYAVSGVFDDANAAAVGWNNFAQAARVGNASVATCEFNNNAQGCDAPVGSVTVKNVTLNKDYLTLLIAGSNGTAPVGLKIIQSSNQQELANYIPATCGVTSPWITGDENWVHFDVSALEGTTVDIEIYDNETGGCGFLAFDHLYQGDIAVGTLAATLGSLGVDTDSDGVNDNMDAFPNDPNESVDTDGDGTGDNADAFPTDPSETMDTDSDGVGDNSDSAPNDPNVTLALVNVTLPLEGGQQINIIADFDDPTAIQVDTSKYELTGVFADTNITNWNDLAGNGDAARVGAASVTTCEIGDGNCDAPTGTILIKDVTISNDYINFLMSGGNGGNNVGVRIILSENDSELANYTPNICGSAYLKSDSEWTHFDVSSLRGLVVDILIYDNEEGGCGFLAFDHFYQGTTAQGLNAGVIVAPLLPRNITIDNNNAISGLVPGASFESPTEMLNQGWIGTGAFASPSDDNAWSGTTRDDVAAAAKVGSKAVSTCEINANAEGCDAPTGSITTPAFKVTSNFLQFLMAGGNGGAPVGARIQDTLGNSLVEFLPNSCGPSHIDGDNDWTYFDVSAIADAYVKVQFFDEEAGGCGFVSFDHLYQTDTLHLPDNAINAGAASATSTLGYNVTLSSDAFDQVIGDFDDATLSDWTATGAFELPADADAWRGVSGAGRVGYRAVTTCEINNNAEGCDAPVGKLTSPEFTINTARPYLTLLMAGGNGSAPVGVRVLDAGDNSELASFTPNSCGPAAIDGDDDWVSIDLTGHIGSSVKVEIFDNETGGCGFVSFDHVHMSSQAK